MPAITPEGPSPARRGLRLELGAIFLLALLVVAPALVWHQIPERDSALYALITDELAHGNLDRAFHPSVAPLLTALAGAVAHLLENPFKANQLASILLFALGLPGTFLLVKELRGERAAIIAAWLYAVCPQTVYQATSAGLDAGKLGLLPWLAWAALQWNRHPGATWGLAVGGLGALVAMARGEGIFFAIMAVLWAVVEGLRQRPYRFAALGKRVTGVVGAVLALVLLLLPWLLYQRSQTGLWITHPTQLVIYEWFGIGDRWPRDTIVDANAMEIGATALPVVSAVAPQPPASESAVSRPDFEPPAARSTVPNVPPSESVDLRNNRKHIPWLKNLEKIAKGACIPYLILAVWGAAWRRKANPVPLRVDALPLMLIALNLAIFYPTNILAPRYISATIPLFLHFTADGVLALEESLKRWRAFSRQQLRCGAAAGILILALLAQGRLDIFMPPDKRAEQMALMRLGGWIRQHAGRFPSYGTLPNLSVYHNGRQPILLETDGRLRYYARADAVCLYSFYRYTPAQLAAICRLGKVSLIAYNTRMEALCPGFGQYWPHDPAFSAVDLGPRQPGPPGEDRLILLAFHADGVAPQ
jgi:4-amino-4-deoxy-L-arabinose transferase-like glycosyltransferase